jgi:Relaxase/Mobilisation nuclease domain
MPAGTPPQKVLTALKNFAREEFRFKHRYAMVLHTDEPHPHVHLVVEAMGADGKRLNIRRATLREWRREFARLLREQGVAANATERAVRGNSRSWKLDAICRAELRGESHRTRERAEVVARDLLESDQRVEAAKSRLLETRKEVERGWWARLVTSWLPEAEQTSPPRSGDSWRRCRRLRQAAKRSPRPCAVPLVPSSFESNACACGAGVYLCQCRHADWGKRRK